MRVLIRNQLRDVVINAIIGSSLVPKPLRWRLLRAVGFDVARSSISPGCFFGSTRVSIGRETFVNYRCFFDALDRVTIGERCDIAMEVIFTTSSHEVGGAERRGGASVKAPITIGDGVWIGARATILPGVTVGDGSIVAAGAVVTRDCAPNGLYAGVPARRIRELDGASPLEVAN
jgi:acetyltransferase-like isoleucine patch superfamily enzyme